MSIELNNQDESNVSKVLASLPHVEPPGDFDVRVRSRIAAGRPADRRSWFWPVLAGATPLVLLLGIGSYFVLRPDASPSPNLAFSANAVQPSPIVAAPADAPIVVATNSSQSPIPDRMIAKAPTIDDGMVLPTGPSRGPNARTSEDMSVTTRTTINPRGIDTRPRSVPRPRDFDVLVSIPIKDVLTQFGADSQPDSGKVKVVSVTSDGAASRLGLRANDVIDSIDDKPVNDKTSYKGKFAGKKMKVVRDGQTVEIDLSKP